MFQQGKWWLVQACCPAGKLVSIRIGSRGPGPHILTKQCLVGVGSEPPLAFRLFLALAVATGLSGLPPNSLQIFYTFQQFFYFKNKLLFKSPKQSRRCRERLNCVAELRHLLAFVCRCHQRSSRRLLTNGYTKVSSTYSGSSPPLSHHLDFGRRPEKVYYTELLHPLYSSTYRIHLWGSARQIYSSILLQTALNKSTQTHRRCIIKLIF
jgi:hypothetical protein